MKDFTLRESGLSVSLFKNTRLGTACILLFVMAAISSAKVKSSLLHSMQFSQSAASLKNVQALEERLRPFLQQRINHFHSYTSAENRLHESDLFLLVKVWNSLSPEFKKLYKEATQIPNGYTYYVSPSGHFEIYYTTTLDGSVDATDHYGFGDSTGWRPKNNQPNGVPDYVDEVAWDLDSAWSMEINRFQYIQPIPYIDATHGSNRFKVVIASLGPGWYGETLPDDPAATQGFSSHIEIRNEWSDPDWAGTGYDTVPYSGARVTCAHEFFHTIQFAMAWNLNVDGIPDSFPLSWIEGTAVMMEGLAFEYVHDYLQYTWDYFDNPTITMLDPSDRNQTVYTNSLITKFLHERYSPDPDNDFIRHIFFNDYNAPVNFYEDLRSVSSSLGKNWVDVLNGFHAQSFFTGARAVTGIFIQDAPLLPEWSYSYDTITTTGKITKQINPYGMQVFALQPAQVQQVQGDTLGLVFQGDQPTGAPAYPTWSASCIFERLNGTDSTVRFAFANNTLAAMEIPSWHSLHDALVIVTNGDLAASHNASVSIQTCPVTYHRGDLQKIHLVSPDSQSAITVDLTTENDLACSLSVEMANQSLYKIPNSKLLFSSLYRINFPLFWGSDAAISCSFSVQLSHIAALSTKATASIRIRS